MKKEFKKVGALVSMVGMLALATPAMAAEKYVMKDCEGKKIIVPTEDAYKKIFRHQLGHVMEIDSVEAMEKLGEENVVKRILVIDGLVETHMSN